MSTDSLHVTGVLRRTPVGADDYGLVIRWMLGQSADLPKTTDRFQVQVRLAPSGLVLQEDDTFGPPAGMGHRFEVGPQLAAMLDAPRVPIPLFPWSHPEDPMVREARPPTKPVSCVSPASGTLPEDEGFGVCHLLDDSTPERTIWRAARELLPHARARVRLWGDRPLMKAMRAADDSDPGQALAWTLARALVAAPLRPSLLLDHLPRAMERVLDGGSLDEVFPLLPMGAADQPQQLRWAFTAAGLSLLSDAGLRERLDEVVGSRSGVRDQLRLRALQGGSLIDYWGTDGGADRGRQVPASELLGTGVRLGAFSRAQVEAWAAAGESITVTVFHTQSRDPVPEVPLDVADDRQAGDAPREGWKFRQAGCLIGPALLRAALEGGSSNPPARPTQARVGYDLVRLDSSTPQAPQYNWHTGDGQIEIVVTPGEYGEYKAVFGYNVYGMWESAETAHFFADGAPEPTLDELRPWLVTRRYSHHLDLKSAFPDQGGRPHPFVLAVLHDPPWSAQFERAESTTDVYADLGHAVSGGSGAPSPFPDVVHQAQTVWRTDLRVGMLSEGAAPLPGWDPRGVPRLDWTPALLRDGRPLPQEWRHPQRYRFWVTAADWFEQESAPVPVEAHDAAAGQPRDLRFAPLRRVPLNPPPADEEAKGIRRRIAFDVATRALTLEWETAFAAALGVRTPSADERAREDPQDLLGYAVLFRRHLRGMYAEGEKEGWEDGLGVAEKADHPVFRLPGWRRMEAERREAGWEPFARLEAVRPPATGHRWTARHPLVHGDTGYEYVAALGFVVPDERAFLWAPNVVQGGSSPGRCARVAVADEGGGFAEACEWVDETPRVSAIVLTAPVAVPNPQEPRGVTLKPAQPFHLARPVLSPPGLERDRILRRVLGHTFVNADGSPATVKDWAGTGFELGAGQAAMLVAAIARTEGVSAADPALRPVLHLLAAELAAGAPTADTRPSLRQHPSVGFRGVQEIHWRYTPCGANAAEGEAEAVSFRIFAVRVPELAARAEAYATVRARGEQVGPRRVRLSEIQTETDGALAPLVAGAQPALAWIGRGDRDPVISNVATLRMQDGVAVLETDDDVPDAGGGAVRVLLFAAQPQWDLPVRSLRQPEDYHLLLPVGGGSAEVAGWWVAGLSAQQRLTGSARRPCVVRRFGPTIQPLPVVDLRVQVPSDPELHRLDPAADRAWLPREVATVEDSRSFPRLVVSWSAADRNRDEIMVILREQKRVRDDDDQAKMFSLAARTAWEVLQEMDRAPEAAVFQRSDLDLISPWLLGRAVDTPGALASAFPTLIAASRGLSALRGVREIPVDTGTGRVRRPCLVDYYRYPTDTDPAAAMDGNWQYRYVLQALVDLAPGNGPPPPDEWRYLRSAPTLPSESHIPEPPPLEIMHTEGETVRLPATHPPRVRFRISAVGAGLRASHADLPEGRWFYRIIVTRQLQFVLRTAPDRQTDTPWIEVGAPVEIVSGGEGEIVDDRIERADARESLKWTYRVHAQQFFRADGTAHHELPARGRAPFTLQVEIPTPGEGYEVEVVPYIRLE